MTKQNIILVTFIRRKQALVTDAASETELLWAISPLKILFQKKIMHHIYKNTLHLPTEAPDFAICENIAPNTTIILPGGDFLIVLSQKWEPQEKTQIQECFL